VASCTLRIGDRVALASVGGAPEVEYALFDPGEIELLATGPGMVQEAGYQTVAEEAIARLEECGVTWPLVLETATAMHPTIAITYARGPEIRRIASSLGPAELMDGFRYDPLSKVYEGRWLDLPALAADAKIPRLTQALQSMHLLALLEDVNPGDPVQLVTRDHMATARPGQRSFRRYHPPDVERLPEELRRFAEELRATPASETHSRSAGPTAAEILDILRDRIVLVPNAESQDRLRAIEKAVGIRQRPMRGPLADPELWALDEQLSSGRPEGILELVDALEKTKGKQPATAYLRVRTALIGGREPPRGLAERIATMALGMPTFVELELLAAEAWNSAGDPKKALPFVRDLISNATVNDELRVRESQQIPARRPSQANLPAVNPQAPTLSMPPAIEPHPRSPVPPAISMRSEGPSEGGRPITAPPRSRETLAIESVRDPAPLRTTPSKGERSSYPPLKPRHVTSPTHPSPASSRKETPPMMFGVPDPNAPTSAPVVPTTRSPSLKKRPISGTWVGPAPQPSQPPGAHAPDAQFGAVPPPTPPSERQPQPSTARTPLPPAPERQTSRPPGDAPRRANMGATELMRGASQPPFRSDSPDAHAHVPKAPPVPQFDEAEAAAALTLPEGLRGVPAAVETLPHSVLDARVQFTFLSRELGREYDEKLGIVLRADVSGVEAMQRVLLERYASRAIATPEAAADIRRHGAFLSEILARTFSAFWVDIGPNDVGYWAMVVPPGTRVWPFGRILRLIAMQHNERDLVSYFLELSGRARG